jgi:hypothetical protein
MLSSGACDIPVQEASRGRSKSLDLIPILDFPSGTFAASWITSGATNLLCYGAACASVCGGALSRQGYQPDQTRDRGIRHRARKRSRASRVAFCSGHAYVQHRESSGHVPQYESQLRSHWLAYGHRCQLPSVTLAKCAPRLHTSTMQLASEASITTTVHIWNASTTAGSQEIGT